jgi:hypothetical protein
LKINEKITHCRQNNKSQQNGFKKVSKQIFLPEVPFLVLSSVFRHKNILLDKGIAPKNYKMQTKKVFLLFQGLAMKFCSNLRKVIE